LRKFILSNIEPHLSRKVFLLIKVKLVGLHRYYVNILLHNGWVHYMYCRWTPLIVKETSRFMFARVTTVLQLSIGRWMEDTRGEELAARGQLIVVRSAASVKERRFATPILMSTTLIGTCSTYNIKYIR
jgi:hypothetical protein